MSTARRLHYSYDEYLAALEASTLKLEYCEGNIYAMAGGTPAHAQLAAATIVALARIVRADCRIATSDLKIRVEATDLSTFPDVSVVCGDAETAESDPNAVTNPTLLVEVTSRSTEDYDRGEKLSHYKQLPALRGVVFVSHRTPRLTLVARTDDGWSEKEARSGESLTLPGGWDLPVDAVYAGIALDPA
jgi:Uma2 family endonuclease